LSQQKKKSKCWSTDAATDLVQTDLVYSYSYIYNIIMIKYIVLIFFTLFFEKIIIFLEPA